MVNNRKQDCIHSFTDVISYVTEHWLSASVVNYNTVTCPTALEPGYDLPCCTWCQLNHFQGGPVCTEWSIKSGNTALYQSVIVNLMPLNFTYLYC